MLMLCSLHRPVRSLMLGHSQLKTTQRYAHLLQATLLEAIDAASR